MEQPRTEISAPDEAHASELLELGDAFLELDRDWRIVRVNGRQELLSRKPRSETLGRVFWEVWPEAADPRSQYWRQYHRAMELRVAVQFRAYFAPLDLWTGVTAHPVSGGGIAVFFRDVTELKRAEDATRQREGEATARAAEVEAVLGAVAEGVLVYDADGRLVRSNAAADRILEHDARLRAMPLGEHLASSGITWLRPDGSPLPSDELPSVRAARHAETHRGVIVGMSRPDRLQWLSMSAAPLVVSGVPSGAVVSIAEITGRRRAEAALRESERRLRRMVDVNPIGVVERDVTGRVRYANDAYLKMIHRTREDLEAGRVRWDEVTAPESLGADDAAMARAQADGASTVFEKEYLLDDGGRVPALMALASTGVAGEFIGFVVDLSDVKRAEAALRESEARHRAFFQNVMELAGVHEAVRDASGAVVDSVVTEVNDPVLRFLGRRREEVLGRRLSEVMSPELLAALTAPWTAVLATGAPARYEVELGGHVLLVSASRMSADAIAAVADDITERKRAERALRDSEQRFRLLAEAMPQIVCVLAPDGRTEYVNPGWVAFSGLDLDATNATGWDAIVHPDDLPAAADCRRRALKTLAPQDVELRYRAADGAFRWFLCRLAPLAEAGRVTRFVGAAMNIDDRKRAEDALRASEANLREADRRKDEFLGMLSHELRNPLAPIRNSLYILDRSDGSGEQARRAKEIANRQIAHLTRLVDDLLDVTRIARGRIELRRARFDLRALVRRSAEDHRALMHERRLLLSVDVPERPVPVDGDETRLAQVLGNLLHNAAKFTAAGGRVNVAVAIEEGEATIRVRDTGAGISEDVLPTIFEPFTQAKQTLARSEGGLGLGLALVKGLVAMHGGDVTASSAGPGYGTEFVVRLPLAAPAIATGRAPRAQPEAAAGGHRVLVIDDNRDAADSLAQLVAMLGHEVEVAYDAFDALAKATERLPDVVLCDIGLPGMDGYQLARQLRALASPAREVRLVAVSGYAQPEDVTRAVEAGFDAHVAKPPDPERLAGLLG